MKTTSELYWIRNGHSHHVIMEVIKQPMRICPVCSHPNKDFYVPFPCLVYELADQLLKGNENADLQAVLPLPHIDS